MSSDVTAKLATFRAAMARKYTDEAAGADADPLGDGEEVRGTR